MNSPECRDFLRLFPKMQHLSAGEVSPARFCGQKRHHEYVCVCVCTHITLQHRVAFARLSGHMHSRLGSALLSRRGAKSVFVAAAACSGLVRLHALELGWAGGQSATEREG